MAQILASLWVLPQAGMAVMRTPCLTIQNNWAGFQRSAASCSLGGRGISPWRISESLMPGARWQPTHISR